MFIPLKLELFLIKMNRTSRAIISKYADIASTSGVAFSCTTTIYDKDYWLYDKSFIQVTKLDLKPKAFSTSTIKRKLFIFRLEQISKVAEIE